jgi:hypothetical protein
MMTIDIDRKRTELVQHTGCRGNSHRHNLAVLVILLIWFGYIVRLSQRRRRGSFAANGDYYLPSLRLVKGEGGDTCVDDQT